MFDTGSSLKEGDFELQKTKMVLPCLCGSGEVFFMVKGAVEGKDFSKKSDEDA
jgi:hypothetical protein